MNADLNAIFVSNSYEKKGEKASGTSHQHHISFHTTHILDVNLTFTIQTMTYTFLSVS